MSYLKQLRELDKRINGKNGTIHPFSNPLQKLRELEERFSKKDLEKYHLLKQLDACFEYSINGIALVGITGRFLKVNRRCAQIFERTEKELLSLTWQEITHPDDIKPDENQVTKALDEFIEGYTLTKRYVMPSGKYKKCLLHVAIISDPITEQPSYFVSEIIELEAFYELFKTFVAGEIKDER